MSGGGNVRMRNMRRVALLHPLSTEVKVSAKWASILFVPDSGSPHCDERSAWRVPWLGRATVSIAFAPFVAVDALLHIPRSNNLAGLLIAIPIEWAYLFLIVLVFRWVFHHLNASDR